MRDVHCHIVPGVDDGARDLEESLAMFQAARAAGVTSIVATPHARGHWYNPEKVHEAFGQLKRAVHEIDPDFSLTLGWEVYYDTLMELGIECASELGFEGTSELLLEFSTNRLPLDYQRVLYQLQGKGLQVIIAHPERYVFVQKDVSIAESFVAAGCSLQASADCVSGGIFDGGRKCAKRLFDKRLYSYIASDAHRVEHYANLVAAKKTYRSRGAHANV